ncbi:Coiled-coil domain-containing protein 12 [Clydaea vesicula]|uniref:Coiled-coil domain-containing protein 12 n=1 Tax=Clydaea vesicula TaxID=447962 RepID=A0AAD5U2N9_9FUNG|nr:Coiled-coil domain-containing protein 12 [Clydaea vesicula]KAJ3397837.1 Coiled-coil domain-containing protein 12 [Lobulomyces angularis]
MSSLQNEVAERKKRLAEWKKRKQEGTSNKKQKTSTNGNTQTKDTFIDVINFRNYTPSDKRDVDQDDYKGLQNSTKEAKKTNDIIEEVGAIEKQVKEFENDAKKAEESRIKELDLYNLAPKKADFDLKRDLDKKLEKLEKKTKSSITQLIRERLKASGELTDGKDNVNNSFSDEE